MFCPACAAPLEPSLRVCPKCGEPIRTPVSEPIAPLASIAPVASPKPHAIGLAGKLLWITIAMGLFSTAYYMLRYGSSLVMSPNFVLFYVLEMAAWIVAVVLTLRRNTLARVALLLLVAFAILNTLRNAWMHPFRIDVEYSLWLLELGLRVWACYLLLRPESNAWFRAASAAGSPTPTPTPSH